MSMYICINEEIESVKYVLTNNIKKVVKYLNDKDYSITEMPSYMSLAIKDYVTIN